MSIHRSIGKCLLTPFSRRYQMFDRCPAHVSFARPINMHPVIREKTRVQHSPKATLHDCCTFSEVPDGYIIGFQIVSS